MAASDDRPRQPPGTGPASGLSAGGDVADPTVAGAAAEPGAGAGGTGASAGAGAAAEPAAVASDAPTPPRSARARAGRGKDSVDNMLPARRRRRFGLERIMMRLIATCGIVGIGVALGAILISSKVQGWITGLVVAGVSVILSGVLWSSREV